MKFTSPYFLYPLVFGVLLLITSELVSKQWQADPGTAELRGIYQESLQFQPPRLESVSIQTLPIEESQVGYLTHDRGRRYAYFDRKESRGMELLVLEYDGNSPRFFFDLFNHPPERCMASTGAEVTERYPTTSIEVDGTECMVQRLKVTSPQTGEDRYIFKLTWVHPDHPIRYGASIHLKRVQAALATVPPPPARLLMAGMYGFSSEEEASQFFDAWVLQSLKSAAQ
jgi:hypothetical protein